MKENFVYLIGLIGYPKFYIGSTCRGIARKREHFYTLKNGSHSNSYLQRAYDKFGESKVFFHILERVESVENLRLREQFWIDSFDTTNKNCGMNLVKDVTKSGTIGFKHTMEQRKAMSKIVKGRKANGKIAEGVNNCHSKNYTIYNPLGEKIEVKNLKFFCKEQGLDYNRMLKVVGGDFIEEKGFKKDPDRKNLSIKEYKFISPDNEIVSITNLRKFCKENKIEPRCMYNVHTENILSYKGWRKYTETKIKRRGAIKRILNPLGEEIITRESLEEFCILNNIKYDKFRRSREWMGWRILDLEYEGRSYKKVEKNMYYIKNIITNEILFDSSLSSLANKIKGSHKKLKSLINREKEIYNNYCFEKIEKFI